MSIFYTQLFFSKHERRAPLFFYGGITNSIYCYLLNQATYLKENRRKLATITRRLTDLSGALDTVRAATAAIAEEGGPVFDHIEDFQAVRLLRGVNERYGGEARCLSYS